MQLVAEQGTCYSAVEYLKLKRTNISVHETIEYISTQLSCIYSWSKVYMHCREEKKSEMADYGDFFIITFTKVRSLHSFL